MDKEGKCWKFPIRDISQVVCFTYAGLSPGCMRLCLDFGIDISLLAPSGHFIASVIGDSAGNVLLRREQFRIADNPERGAPIVRNMLLGKLGNSRNVLVRGLKDHPETRDSELISKAINAIVEGSTRLISTDDFGVMRSIEGDCAKRYFKAIDVMIRRNKNQFFIDGRNRRPPCDRMNAFMSFMYAVMTNEIRSALSSAGLDPYVGFLHTDRPGRLSLALDMLEEFRPVVDRFVLTTVNRLEIGPDDFEEYASGAVMLNDDGRKAVLSRWKETKKKEITHPYLGEDVEFGLIPQIQSHLLAAHVRGDIPGYPPYVA